MAGPLGAAWQMTHLKHQEASHAGRAGSGAVSVEVLLRTGGGCEVILVMYCLCQTCTHPPLPAAHMQLTDAPVPPGAASGWEDLAAEARYGKQMYNPS